MTEEIIKKAAIATKEWEHNGFFKYSNFEKVYDYVFNQKNSIVAESFPEASSEFSEMVLSINSVVNRVIMIHDVSRLINIPYCREWNGGFLRILPDSQSKKVFVKLFETTHKNNYSRLDHIRDRVWLDYKDNWVGLVLDDVSSQPLRSFLTEYFVGRSLSHDEYCFAYHVMCVVYLYLAFNQVEKGQTLTSRAQNRSIGRHVIDYYRKVIGGVMNNTFREYLTELNDPLPLCELEVLDLEDKISSLYDDIFAQKVQKEKEKKAAILEERSRGYQYLQSAYQGILGKCQHVFSYDLSLYKPEKDIYLYNNGKIIIYGSLYDLNKLESFDIVNETSVRLCFPERDVLIECRTPENLKEFISLTLDKMI